VTDPILERRARMARLASRGQRVGYLALLVAVVGFFWALFADFPSAATTLVIAGMVLATVTLAPAIVLGYAVKAAQREDDERN
jgi:hypothetical protein